MSDPQPRLLVTGASGRLGRMVVDSLLTLVPATQVAALVRSEAAAERLAALGVRAHLGDYSRPETLDAALAGVDRALLISSNDMAARVEQHGNVVSAAKRAGVGLLAYTSVLRADSSPLGVAVAHRATEALIRESGVPFVLLRNSWYTENYVASAPAAVARGAVIGSAGDGRIASAARADYAAAAAAALTSDADLAGRVFELAGDEAYTLADLAAELARQSGKPIVYRDLSQDAFAAALVDGGLPERVASLLANSDVGASKGALFDDGHQLSTLIGRPTTTLAASVAAALGVL